MKKTILTTALLFLISGMSFGQTEIFNLVGGGAFPAGWDSTNNVAKNDIDRGSYWLLDAGNPSDIITTSTYDLSAYSTATFSLDITSFGSGVHHNAKIEFSTDGGATFPNSSTTVPTTTSYAGSEHILPSVSNQVVIRITNTGSSGRGIRLQNLKLVGTLAGGTPTKLVVTAVNSSNSPSVGTAFDVTVQAQDASNIAANVSGAVNVTLSKATGSGILGGTLTGTIADGTNEITISGVTFDTAESGVSITATDNAANLTAGTSATFTVLSAADQLVFASVPSEGIKNTALSSFTVTAQRNDDSSTDLNYTKDITISVDSGTGTIGGTVTKAAVAGVATFDDITFDTDGSFTIEATDNAITSNPSSAIVITTFYELFLLENFNNALLTASYANDSFVGNHGFTWTYVSSRDHDDDKNNSGISGKAIMLRNQATGSKITSSTIPGGIGNFSVKLYKGFTGTGNRQVELFVNGVSKGTSTPFNDYNEHIFSIDGLNISGNVIIELRNVTSNQVIVDDIYWTSIDDRIKLSINGNEGWRMLSTPTSDDKYSDLLSNVWTQGFTGANYGSGSPNVQTFDTGTNSFGAISNLTDAMTAGQGFITYIYSDDDYTNSEANTGFPKTLSVTGTLNTAPVSASINTAAEKWSLVGNPFNSTIIWGNDLVRTDLTGVVYVYDHSYATADRDDVADTSSAGGNYRVWNGTTGSLTDGKIAPFQGFWVQNVAELAGTPALQFTEASKSTGGQFYKQSTQSASFRMIAQMDGFANDAYFSFTNEGNIGKDNYDGLKLAPLDYANYLSLGTEVNGVLMDINNLPFALKENAEFPVEINSFKKIDGGYALKGGEVTLSLADLKNIPAEWGIVFNNYNTGETIDLRAQDSYTFEIAAKEKMVKAKTAFSVLSPAGVTREKSMGASGFSITIQPEKTPVTLEPKDEPKIFALEQNYPNPFNPTTTIKYSVADVGHVNLAVFNIMGQKVAELVNSSKQAGNYAVSWQAQDMASGLYFYRLSAAGQTITRQMTLIK
ncbi:MAG: T9SS type A sorting domain-containing protein [Balneolaceae bacterium]